MKMRFKIMNMMMMMTLIMMSSCIAVSGNVSRVVDHFISYLYVPIHSHRNKTGLRQQPTAEDESSLVEPVWNSGNQQTDTMSRTSLEQFRKIAMEESNENAKSEMLKLLDFYDQVSSREDALKKKVEEFHDKRNDVLQKMQSIHRTVRADREKERAGLQMSIE